MYLLHSTNSESKILREGELKPSAVTKNIQLYGLEPGSPYIYLRLKIKNDTAPFYLDYKLLLEHQFYLNVGWSAEPTSKIIDGRKITADKLKDLLTDFKKDAEEYYAKRSKDRTFPLIMNNEILVLGNIDMHKYLKKIRIKTGWRGSKTITNLIDKHYPHVKKDIVQ
jgi:glutaredoxin